MNKTMKKALITIAFLAATLTVSFGTVALATGNQEIINNIDPANKGITVSDGKNLVPRILAILKYIAIAIALAMLIIIGIQYVSGSSDQKSKIKDSAITYLFGAILIFGAVGVLSAIENLVSSLNEVPKAD